MKKIIFIVCGLLLVNVAAFGQEALEKDLKKSFRKFELVKLDNNALREKARTEQPIEIQAYGRNFEFVLQPNDLRAANYRAAESTDAGERQMEKQIEVTTYKGKLSDDAQSEVRFTVGEETVEGFIYTGDNQKFFVERAVKFSKSALKSDAVVYGENDLLKTVDLSDDAESLSGELPIDIEGKIDFGLGILQSSVFGSTTNVQTVAAAAATAADLRAVEVATEADYQWVTQAGGASAANNEILGILNLVDGIYQRDLGLTVKVTFQHAWSTADSYPTNSTSALLGAFSSYWNANYPASQFPRDVAHLFTGKFSNQGIAYVGVTCRSQTSAYGLTARSGSVNHLITAHEIGHNLGAEHIDNSGACALSIMNPILYSGVTAFCETSKTAIANYVSTNGSCLSLTSTTTPTPTPIATPTPTATPVPTPSCTYSITPASQTFSAAGGTGSVTVTTQSGCSWTAATNQNFVGIASGGSGNGSGTVIYSVAQNSNAASRSATLVIAGQIFTIQQAAGATSNTTKTRFDFDGEGKADISVFRPSNGVWYVSRSSDNSFYANSFGQAGDIPAATDFDGDGKTDVAVFRPSNGTWYLQRSTAGFIAVQFGQAGDVPVPGDFDGDGRADVSVFRPSSGTWYRLNSSTGQFAAFQFGQPGDTPIIGDFDVDARCDFAVFRPANGTWYVLRSSDNSFYDVGFGQSGDVPTAADFDGDKKTDIAVYRPNQGVWYRLNSSTGGFFAQQFGAAEDKPTAADFDGDGRADIAVFRPSTGTWYLQRTTAGFLALQFGTTGDVPIPTVSMP